ncbi:hypothetical protein C7N43_17045 [Sphingobacteriales bacterium UPWRP_1]|nr:hypothetical protein BVG80_12875 [Sphingobacteriales bacterium TSM_CSM]PSJ75781.1 hypothetical protein C7N43_17045 [Sphingobacteriales bacterium UPWRP_1]
MEIGEVYFIFAKKTSYSSKILTKQGLHIPSLENELAEITRLPRLLGRGVYCSASLPVSFLYDERPNKAAKKFNKVYPSNEEWEGYCYTNLAMKGVTGS